jgi:hypothetical protein
MANHGYVKTRKAMKPEAITAMLADLNITHFKGNLKVEYCKGEESSWGPHIWELAYFSDKEYAHRICWLNNNHSFEMRHGGGTHFAWWLDSVVTNEVAACYNGMISDDGIVGKWKGEVGKHADLHKFLEQMMAGNEALRNWLMDGIPPEFLETKDGSI